MSETVTLALWARNLAEPMEDFEAWAAATARGISKAKADGAEMAVLPEYMTAQFLSFAPDDLAPAKEIAWLAEWSGRAREAIRKIAREAGIAVLAGTMPWPQGRGHFTNRAHLCLPDGRVFHQDKLALTPNERNAERWLLRPGEILTVMNWNGWRVATLICLDVEMPALSAKLAPLDLDLILVPSMTERLSGSSRVFGCAKARAVELMCAVAATGAIGMPPRDGQDRGNTGRNAVYLPCEPAFGDTGIAAETPPRDAANDAGPMTICRDVPLARIRECRRKRGGEVWPGAWTADHIVVAEE